MCILRISVPTTKAINEYIIKTTGFTSFFWVENMTMSMTCSDGVHPDLMSIYSHSVKNQDNYGMEA